MRKKNFGAFTAVTALAVTCGLWGCVADRPSRNGVFNENQYLRKDFLIRPGDGSQPDPGWFVKSTIVQTDTPNPLGNVGGAGLFAGAEGQTANFVRFAVTQDKLQVINMRELSADPTSESQQQRTPEIVNAWPVTNVDLKYQINLDGEKTNFYQENQELDWQVRQWVKLNFAKNDLSDLYQFGANTNAIIQKCTDLLDASVTLVDGSFQVDEANEYFQFMLSITLPIAFDTTVTTNADGTTTSDAQTCVAAFGAQTWQTFEALGRQNVTLNVLTAFVRPDKIVSPTYIPMPIYEKDPIQHKYGAFQVTPIYRDPNTQLLGAQQLIGRFDPNQPITYYLAPGLPPEYQEFFVGADKTGKTTGLQAQTNQILAQAGAKGRLTFLNYNDATTFGDGAGPVRQYGDPRYSFINWHTDLDSSSALLGIAQFFSNPMTGQTMSASVNVWEGPFKDTVDQRLEAFLQTVGAEYLLPDGSDFDNTKYPATCTAGQTVPLVPADITSKLNQQSTVYNKMQAMMQKPFANYGYLGPADFVPSHQDTSGNPDEAFWSAFYAVLPYQTYADPQANQFVLPDSTVFANAQAAQWAGLQNLAKFQSYAAQLDQGVAPFDVGGSTGVTDSVSFQNTWAQMAEAVDDYQATSRYNPIMKSADDISLFSYFDIYQRDGRHCINGQWESLAQYKDDLFTSLNMAVAAHEFGHTLGLRHNFMGSVDQRNYPTDSNGNVLLYSSSIMDYNQPIVEAFFESNQAATAWGTYDAAALAWIYGNNNGNGPNGPVTPTTTPTGIVGASGQVSATQPWNDPLGWNTQTNTEIPFLYCSDEHIKYTPLCRQYDTGATPAEITSFDIQRREWNYLWNNFRLYHKYFSEVNYPTSVATDFTEMRRFSSLWSFDWSSGELQNDLRLAGIVPNLANETTADFYTEITNKFNDDISIANQLALTYQRAIVDQASGERPFVTVYDPFYGDVTQQGIQLDKIQTTTMAAENWLVTNYDPSQATGVYLQSVAGSFGDPAYTAIGAADLTDLLGAAFATFSYTQVGGISNFAANSHSQKYSGNLVYRDWVGGYAFTRDEDFLTFVRTIAASYNFQNCDENGQNCAPCPYPYDPTQANCSWDPRIPAGVPTQIYQSDTFNRFQSPDGRRWIWMWLQSRNEWVLADQDRNAALANLMFQWTSDVVNGLDDGYNGSNFFELRVRYGVDSFLTYDGDSLNAPARAKLLGN